MKVKRQKRVAKILKYFQLNFGFHAPYLMLIDGTFCAGCLEAKVNIRDQLPKYLGEIKLLTTGCCITELETLGPKLYGATLVAKGIPLFKCGHKTPLAANQCIKSLIAGGNSHHFIVATQDASLRHDLRNVPGIPLIYLHGNSPTLEKPSELTECLTDQVADGKTELSVHQRNVLAELKKQTFGPPPEEPRRKRKRKGPKGPNPLSCKKRKKGKLAGPPTAGPPPATTTAAGGGDKLTGVLPVSQQGKKRKRNRKRNNKGEGTETAVVAAGNS